MEEEVLLSVTTLKRSLDFITTDDWTTLDTVKERSESYRIHNSLVSKAVGALEKLVKESSDYKEERVVNYIKSVSKMWSVHQKRAARYIQNKDWADEYLKAKESKDSEGALTSFNDEIELQSSIEAGVEKLQSRVSVLPINGDTTKKVAIQTYEDKKFSLIMAPLVESKYPEVKSIMEEKSNKPKKSKTR
jgi:hypothetical protein